MILQISCFEELKSIAEKKKCSKLLQDLLELTIAEEKAILEEINKDEAWKKSLQEMNLYNDNPEDEAKKNIVKWMNFPYSNDFVTDEGIKFEAIEYLRQPQILAMLLKGVLDK